MTQPVPSQQSSSRRAGLKKRVAETCQVFAPPMPDANLSLGQFQVALVFVFQTVVLGGALAICLMFGVSLVFTATAALAFAIPCFLLGRSMQASAKSGIPLTKNLIRFVKAGVWTTPFVFILVAFGIYQRADPDATGLLAFSSVAFFVGLGVVMHLAAKASIERGVTPWFHFMIGVTLLPFLFAWLLASVVNASVPPQLRGLAADLQDSGIDQELQLRQAWANNPAWRKQNGEPIRVAVLLSGGGYRAATFHAGVLNALDAQCVPIRYLSTVSGGSIIGTYYALGYSPQSFRDYLVGGKPGLADSILSIWWFAMDLVWPTWNSADTYAWHFSTIYFGNKTFLDTSDTPQLLINATDIEAGGQDAREVFFKNRTPSDEALNKTRLADLVAASGAFPGPFQPKQIMWPDNKGELRERKFADGGIYENLGYTGLWKFIGLESVRRLTEELKSSGDVDLAAYAHVPVDIMIVSDASAVVEADRLPTKVDVIRLLIRSSNISYDSQLNLLRTYISDAGYGPTGWGVPSHWVRAQSSEATPLVDGDVYTGEESRIPGPQIVEEVNGYRTLEEFGPSRVKRAFWLGETLATKTLARVHQWRDKHSSGPSCAALGEANRKAPAGG